MSGRPDVGAIRRLAVVLGVLAAAAATLWAPGDPPDEIRFLQVGQGDATLLRLDGTSILVDAGPRTESFDAGERMVVPRLRALGVDRLDAVLLTHPDLDHIGGLRSVARKMRVGEVWVPACFLENRQLIEEARGAGVRLRGLPDHGAWRVGSWRLDGYWQRPVDPEETNAGSLVLHVSDGTSAAVLSGDAPAEVEESLLRRRDWRAQVLKLGHHGSGSSSSPAWLESVGATIAVASCGRDNRYGHPSAEVRDRLDARGIRLWRTDRHGEAAFRASPRGFEPIR